MNMKFLSFPLISTKMTRHFDILFPIFRVAARFITFIFNFLKKYLLMWGPHVTSIENLAINVKLIAADIFGIPTQ